MEPIGKAFREHVLKTALPGCSVAQIDADKITLTTENAIGELRFYSFEDAPEIVELSIVDVDHDGEPKFFLHFELTDEERAKELYEEMLAALQESKHFDTTRVLLCCTSGITTTMFAGKLADAAKTLSLDYSFEAMPLDAAKESETSYDAVLLAPQVGHLRKTVAEIFPDAVVVQIPAKIFAAYDAGATLKLVMHLLSDNTVFPLADGNNLKVVRDLKNDMRIMIITVINRPRSTWLGWRVYDRGEITHYGAIHKPSPDFRDIEDLLATAHVRDVDVAQLDAVGIAVPGVVNRGSVSINPHDSFGYDLGRTLAKRYGTKVFVDNNANAAAVGCYVSQKEYDSVVLHTQQTGSLIGGQGIVVDGHLVKGRKNFAGELRPIQSCLQFEGANKESCSLGDVAWTPEGMLKTVTPLLVADCCLVSPDAIFVAVDLLDDMDLIHDAMSKHMDEQYIPDLIHVSDYRERVALGELALCLQKLHNPRPHRKH